MLTTFFKLILKTYQSKIQMIFKEIPYILTWYELPR